MKKIINLILTSLIIILIVFVPSISNFKIERVQSEESITLYTLYAPWDYSKYCAMPFTYEGHNPEIKDPDIPDIGRYCAVDFYFKEDCLPDSYLYDKSEGERGKPVCASTDGELYIVLAYWDYRNYSDIDNISGNWSQLNFDDGKIPGIPPKIPKNSFYFDKNRIRYFIDMQLAIRNTNLKIETNYVHLQILDDFLETVKDKIKTVIENYFNNPVTNIIKGENIPYGYIYVQDIKAGEQIGTVNCWGNAYKPHLHFEGKINNKVINFKNFNSQKNYNSQNLTFKFQDKEISQETFEKGFEYVWNEKIFFSYPAMPRNDFKENELVYVSKDNLEIVKDIKVPINNTAQKVMEISDADIIGKLNKSDKLLVINKNPRIAKIKNQYHLFYNIKVLNSEIPESNNLDGWVISGYMSRFPFLYTSGLLPLLVVDEDNMLFEVNNGEWIRLFDRIGDPACTTGYIEVSGDGKKILAACGSTENGPNTLWLVDLETNKQIKLAQSADSWFWYGDISKNGEKVIYALQTDKYYYGYIMDSNGKNKLTILGSDLSSDLDTGYSLSPAFSWDGNSVVFTYYKPSFFYSYYSLCVTNSYIIKSEELLTRSRTHNPNFYPDDKSIIYSKLTYGDTANLYKLDFQTKNDELIIDSQGGSIWNSRYSPDGSKIVFCWKQKNDGKTSLWVSDFNGRNMIPLTDSTDTDASGIFISPDSEYVIYSLSSSKEQKRTDYLSKLDGTSTRTLEEVLGRKINCANWLPSTKIIISLKVGDPYMTVNEIKKEIDPGRGTKPIIIKEWGRTLLPIRAIIETLSGTVNWDSVNSKVSISLKSTNIELWINKPMATVNGTLKWIDDNNHNVTPLIINGRTFVPIRFVAENLGCSVDWEPETMTIKIEYEE